MFKPITSVCVSLVLAASIGGAAFAQQPPPLPRGEAQSGALGVTAQARVTRYMLNPRGEVDGLLLSDGTQVRFPPHMSAELTGAVFINDTVAVQGFRELSGAVRAFAITDLRTNRSVAEHAPTAPPLPPGLRNAGLTPLNATGRIQLLLHAPRGELDGAMLEDGTTLRFPPHVGYRLAPELTIGQAISAQGYGTQNEYGRALELTAIGVAGEPLQPIYDAGPLGEGLPGPVRR